MNPEVEAFSAQLEKQMRPLNDLMNDLRDVGIEKFIELPRIAVVGEQSAGKSSVLESIVGEDFLPKSDELCTRRPLYLRLRKRESEGFSIRIKNSEKGEYKELKTFPDLMKEIEELTSKNAGNKGNIIDDPIYVEIEKPDCPELTLIDLPGIAKNPLEGSEQTDEIEEITKKLIESYIAPNQTIILCVVAGNVDAAASDSFKLAKKHDQEGVRTIGVITKPDIMDEGSDLRKMLEKKYIKLNLGFVAVRNRSKKDVMEGKTIMVARETEKKFFEDHPIYSKMSKDLFGTDALSKKLMKVMQQRINSELPNIKAQTAKRLKEILENFSNLGSAPPTDPYTVNQKIGEIIADYISAFRDRLEGKMTGDEDSDEPYGIGFLYKQFFQFAKKLEEKKVEIDKKKLKKHMYNCPLSGFGSFPAFTMLAVEQSEKFVDPSLNLLDEIVKHMLILGKESLQTLTGKNFHLLMNKIQVISENCIESVKDETRYKIIELLESHDFIFTADEEYDVLSKPDSKSESPTKFLTGLSIGTPKKSYENNVLDVHSSSEEEMVSSLKGYLKIKRRVVADSISQIIGYSFSHRKKFLALLRQ